MKLLWNSDDMKFKKPGPKKKKKVRQKPPEERYCRRCGVNYGNCCYRHAESRIIKFESGGGIMGNKIPDSKTGWLCDRCDRIMSKPLDKNASQKQLQAHADEWNRLIKLSH